MYFFKTKNQHHLQTFIGPLGVFGFPAIDALLCMLERHKPERVVILKLVAKFPAKEHEMLRFCFPLLMLIVWLGNWNNLNIAGIFLQI